MYSMNNHIIGTLGNAPDDVTCSILAARSLGRSITIAPFSEFEFAANSLKQGTIDSMVVPGAYPHISKFIYDDQLKVSNVYTYVIPSLVFVSKKNTQNDSYDIIYNHQATNTLLEDINKTRWNQQRNVSSNTIACLEVLKSKNAGCAITTSACAEKYNLTIHQVLRKGINMPFVVFTRKEDTIK